MNHFLDYRFLGVTPFTTALDEKSIHYILFEDVVNINKIFSERDELLRRDEDIIKVGKCINEKIEIYFAEFGIRITKSYYSYVVFIYNSHPSYNELLNAADSLQEIVEKHLGNIDISKLTSIN